MFAARPGYVLLREQILSPGNPREIPPGWKTQSTGHLNASIDRSCAFPLFGDPKFSLLCSPEMWFNCRCKF